MEGGINVMSSIDERIVEMRFDNKQFESGVQTSLKSIEALKGGLNFDASVKSLSELERAGKSFSLAGIGSAIETIASKFTTLGIIGITALQNITNSAINAGKSLISSLTVDPIKTGLEEYETKMNAIQTILTNTESKGTTLNDVNKALSELNTYADKTIYNFAEMTRNIGTFTAAGVDLKTSTTAIKGIANLAAGSGSSAQQASTAMYQLSQAIAAGSVKLMDWNSVVNAGMGGELFQKALEKTAKELGHGRNMAVSFRESLESGWITTEVLTKTLEKFANDESLIKAATQVKTFTQLLDTMKESVQSGWATSWENIIGNKDEAAALFTGINDAFGEMVGKSTDARNAMLQFWHDNGGRDAIIQAITNAFNGLQSILKPVGEAFREIFPAMTGEKLVEISKHIRDLTANFKIGDETAANLKSTFKGLFALLDIGKQFFSAVAGGIGDVIKYILPAGDGILSFTGSIGEWLVSLDEGIKKSDAFGIGIQKIEEFVTPIADKIGSGIKAIIDWFKSFGDVDLTGLDSFSERVRARFEPFTKLIDLVKGAFDKIGELLKKVSPVFAKLASMFGDAFNKMGENINKALDNADFESIFDIINGGIFAAILLGIKKFMKSITDVTDSAGGFLDKITGILDGVRGCLQAYQQNLQAGTLLKIAGAIGILAASLFTLALIDSEKLTTALMAISVLFIELFGSMGIFEKVMGSAGFKGIGKVTRSMVVMSVAILILSSAMQKLAELDWDGIAKGLVGVGGMMTMLVASAKVLSGGSKAMIRGATGYVIFAAAIVVLAQAVKQLGSLDMGSLAKGLIGVGVLMAGIVLFMKSTDGEKMGIFKSTGILILATSLVVLSQAVKQLSQIDTGELIKGLIAIGVLLGELALFVNTTGDVKHVISTAIGMTILGAAMLIFAEAIGTMGDMSWEQIAKGLITMAGALAEVTLAMSLMPDGMITKALGMIGIATALVILSNALKSMGNMSWEEIAKGLVALGGAMVILVVGLNLMDSALSGAAAMLVVAAALAIIAPVLKTLGGMSWEEIGKGLVTLAGAFAVIGVAGLLLGPIVPGLLGVGAAVILLGIGCLAAGAGILAFSAGLAALAVSGAAGGAALVLVLTGLIGLIPVFLQKVGEGIIEIAKVIANSAPVLKDAFIAVLKAALEALTEAIPTTVDVIFKLLVSILDALDKYIPQIVDKLFSIVIGFIKKVAERLPELIKTGAQLIKAFFEGVIEAIGEFDTTNLLEALGAMAGVFAILALFAASAVAATAGILALTAILGILGAIKQIPGLTWLVQEGSKFLNLIGKTLGEFVGSIIGGVLNKMSDSFPKMAEKLSEFMTNLKPFLDGANGIDQSTIGGIKSLVGAILAITAASVLDGLTSWITGGSAIVKFGEDLAAFGVAYNNYYNSVKGIDGSVVETSANAAKVLAEFASTIPNSGGLVSLITGDNSISQFAEELEKFGPKLMAYGESVKGLDGNVVLNSANAAKALAEMANNLPNQGGVVSWFAGENKLSDFSEQLVLFGPKLMAYAESVKGLDANVVLNSANGAKVLAEMAANLPNQGGIVSWFAGENVISAFGEQLILFGPKLMAYAESVKGLDSNVVLNSANAAKVLSEMAANLPNQGGIVSWFAGENDITVFGQKLTEFGPKLKLYADSISGLDPNVVTNSANAAKALAALANELPNSGGIGSWFAGDNNISAFGNDLVSFGTSLNGYYNSIKGIDFAQLSGAVTQVHGLVDLAKSMEDVSTSAMSNFGDDLTNLGRMGVKGFTSAFIDSSADISRAVDTMLGYVNKEITSEQDRTVSKMTAIVTALIKVIKDKTSEMEDAMNIMMEKTINAIVTKTAKFTDAGRTVITSLTTSIRGYMYDFTKIGEDIDEGIANGIRSRQSTVINAAVSMAVSAYQAAKNALGINSPSKAFAEIGMYSVMGFAAGFKKFSGLAETEATNVGQEAVRSLVGAVSKISDSIGNNIDMQPVIRPVLDLSDIEDGGKKLGSIFAQRRGINMGVIASKIPSVGRANEDPQPNQQSGNGNNINFVQNNYSPKALSRLDIYRQTKNQISSMKGVVVTV
jgi:tape measure domain-containing protein